VAEASHAVFLSYASQDADAAQKISGALRAAGIQVWFDQSALRGGDVWDQTIRKQIKTCVLFIPVVSRHTHERDEGYFRLEWKLAVDRSHLMTGNKAFLLPVVVDDTREDDENVPDKFREVHWTRLPGGETPPAFVAWIQKLLIPDAPTRAAAPTLSGSTVARASNRSLHPNWPSNAVLWVISALVAAGLAYLIAGSSWRPQHSQASTASQNTASSTGAAPLTAAAFNPPPHSIAVVPFVNMSGDKEQEYFSDGLTEELLNSLSRINELQVAGRTSSFYFKGKDVDLGTVAHRLNVAAVLEGSVRRSANTVRVTAQLINARTGFHLWSQTYDRNLGDILALQTDVANSVAGALKVTLLGDVAAKIELGGTRNPAALDSYLRATNAHFAIHNEQAEEPAAIAAYSEAIRLDPNFSLAFASRAIALNNYATSVTGQARRDAHDKAQADARQAIALTPGLAEGHLALANHFEFALDFAQEAREYERALAFAPGNARILRDYGYFAVTMGWTDAGLAALRRALVLDPLNHDAHMKLGDALGNLRRYDESTAAYRELLKIDPDNSIAYVAISGNYFMLGDFQSALSWCKAKPNEFSSFCLASTYDKLGRHSDAEAALVKYTATFGDIYPYSVAAVYAQWGNTAKALEWLEKAMQIRDLNLQQLKLDPSLDPLRKEPRFQAIERALKFPE
jgi:TolB-like protein/tetratricopeptide (TPR) repeat protein